jgi:hypothetical protein
MLHVGRVLARAAGGQTVLVVDFQGRVAALIRIIVEIGRAATAPVGVDLAENPSVEGM